MNRRTLMTVGVALLSACGRPTESSVSEPPDKAVQDLTPLTPPAPGTPGGLPDDRTLLEEPQGAIDPKSAEAAGQVMQQYGALIEQRRFAEATKLWGDSDLTEQQLAEQFAGYSEIHAQVGKPGNTEGAAGSIYVTVPFVLYGRLKSGGQVNRSGTATLRRVNDVDGATQAQLRWHIAQIEFGERD